MEEIHTIKELRAAIRKAHQVFICPRFGCNEDWVPVSKRWALDFLKPYSPSDTAHDLDAMAGLGSVDGDNDVFVG